MPHLNLDGDRLAYEHRPPAGSDAVTFVLFNALTQPLQAWDPVASALHAAGHGTLRFDLRGQPGSTAAPGLALDVTRVVSDARALMDHAAPARPVLVGLSIGGLFAARTRLAGADANGLVLVNTLRAPGPRLEWINHAVLRAAELGGGELVRDLYTPLLAGDAMIRAVRPQAFPAAGYTPLVPDSPLYRLMRDCRDADWDVPWERLDLPVLVMTGHRDNVFRVPADVDRLAARLPHATRLEFEEAGHLLPLEFPEAFAKALADFAATV